MASNTFKIIRDPNRPLQIDRATYYTAIKPGLLAVEKYFATMGPPMNEPYRSQFLRMQETFANAFDALHQEAEAGQ